MKALIDTNILIDYLCGRPQAKREIEQYETPLVSAISVAELMAAATPSEAPIVAAFFKRFEVIACDANVAGLAAGLQQRHGLPMECALIWGCAKAHGALFVTRNKAAYPLSEAGFRNPYEF